MFIRLTRVAGLDATRMRAVMDAISDDLLPKLAEQAGFRGYAVFGNPDSGSGGLSTIWETWKDLERSARVEQELREVAMSAGHPARTPVVETYQMLAWDAPPGSPVPPRAEATSPN
jgi:hypothetical protein